VRGWCAVGVEVLGGTHVKVIGGGGDRSGREDVYIIQHLAGERVKQAQLIVANDEYSHMTETELLGAGLLTGFFLAQGRAYCIFAIFFMERLTPLLSYHDEYVIFYFLLNFLSILSSFPFRMPSILDGAHAPPAPSGQHPSAVLLQFQACLFENPPSTMATRNAEGW
jgi:hypothetical protein